MKDLILPQQIFETDRFGIRFPIEYVANLPAVSENNYIAMFDYGVIAEWCENRKKEGQTHIILYRALYSEQLTVCSEKWAKQREMHVVNVEELLAPAISCPDFIDLL